MIRALRAQVYTGFYCMKVSTLRALSPADGRYAELMADARMADLLANAQFAQLAANSNYAAAMANAQFAQAVQAQALAAQARGGSQN